MNIFNIDPSFFKGLYWFVFLFTIGILVIVLPIILFRDWVTSLFKGPLLKRRLRQKGRRIGISKEVQREVWRRDGGRCVGCESQERLEFDHIIPISKGGSNTTRNIQLLCEECNRKKSDKV